MGTTVTIQEREVDFRQRGITTPEAIAAEFQATGVCPWCGDTGYSIEKIRMDMDPKGWHYTRCIHYNHRNGRNIWQDYRPVDGHYIRELERRLKR